MTNEHMMTLKNHACTGVMAGIAALVLSAGAAQAQVSTFGDMADTVGAQGGQVADLLGVAAFLLGILLAVMGLMKFRQNSQNPNDPNAKVSTAFILVFVGAAMVAIPTLLGVGVTSFFGDGAETVTATGAGEGADTSNMRSIGN